MMVHRHLLPQSRYIKDEEGNVLVDAVYSYSVGDDVYDIVDFVCEELGAVLEANRTRRIPSTYRRHYSGVLHVRCYR